MSARILLVEDEHHIAQGLIFNLEAEGYQVSHVESGEEALELLEGEEFDLLVLDLMLPGINGFAVCDRVREGDSQLPILILTAKGSEHDRVKGLRLGADDYLTKPFSLDEFLLRVQGMLKRSGWYRSDPELLEFGRNRIDLREGHAETAVGPIELTEQELKLLVALARREGELLSRGELLQQAWEMDPETETRTLDNFIARLRRYFEADPASPEHFLTVRGRGYRFVGRKSD